VRGPAGRAESIENILPVNEHGLILKAFVSQASQKLEWLASFSLLAEGK
jgi:hypothetical protein